MTILHKFALLLLLSPCINSQVIYTVHLRPCLYWDTLVLLPQILLHTFRLVYGRKVTTADHHLQLQRQEHHQHHQHHQQEQQQQPIRHHCQCHNRLDRNQAAKNSTPQPPPPPPPTPKNQPAVFQPNHLPGYLEHWMNSFNPALTHAPPPHRRAVSNNFN